MLVRSIVDGGATSGELTVTGHPLTSPVVDGGAGGRPEPTAGGPEGSHAANVTMTPIPMAARNGCILSYEPLLDGETSDKYTVFDV